MTDTSLSHHRIGVLMGGCSSEKEISLKTGHAIAQALTAGGCQVVPIELQRHAEEEVLEAVTKNNISLVFIAMHGAFGEDGTLQAILEKKNIPFTGSDSRASRLAMNKGTTQQIMRQNGIDIPEYRIIEDMSAGLDTLTNEIHRCPLVVKPAAEGSSVGITIIRHPSEVPLALEQALALGQQALLERYIPGREITVGLLGDQALTPIEIRPREGFFDFKAKYEKGRTEYLIPAPISGQATRAVQEVARRAFDLLGCRDFARADFILDEQDRPFFLEMNTIPGFTSTSLLPMAARQAGLSFEDLCLRILGYALKRHASQVTQ